MEAGRQTVNDGTPSATPSFAPLKPRREVPFAQWEKGMKKKPTRTTIAKHVARPATLADVLRTYGMTSKQFAELQAYLAKRVNRPKRS